MTVDDRALLNSGMRTRFALFLIKVFAELHPGQGLLDTTWYLRAICHALGEVALGRSRRLVINVPPRHLKSITVSIAWVAWLLGHDPTRKIMVASYGEDLSRAHADLFRQVMSTAWYRELFPGARLRANSRVLDLRTTSGGGRKAVSVGGPVTGHGADFIVIDDCMKAEDASSEARRIELDNWFVNTLLTRLNNKGTGCIVSIQQRLHEDDLPARLINLGYDHLNLPAIAERDEEIAIGPGRIHRRRAGDLLDPRRESKEVLDELRAQLGPMAFSAQYQQDPVVPGGNMVQWDWFGSYNYAAEREDYDLVVQSWDTASSLGHGAAWSVCLTLGFIEGKWELLDIWRDHLTMPDLVRRAKRLYADWRPDKLLIENRSSGIGLLQMLERDLSGARRLLVPVAPTASKEDRLDRVIPLIEEGLVLVPEEAPWLDPFRRELAAFPNGRFDDQVDALSQFLEWTRTRGARTATNPPPPRRFPTSRGMSLRHWSNEQLLNGNGRWF